MSRGNDNPDARGDDGGDKNIGGVFMPKFKPRHDGGGDDGDRDGGGAFCRGLNQKRQKTGKHCGQSKLYAQPFCHIADAADEGAYGVAKAQDNKRSCLMQSSIFLLFLSGRAKRRWQGRNFHPSVVRR